jgi:hypothetical protein
MATLLSHDILPLKLLETATNKIWKFARPNSLSIESESKLHTDKDMRINTCRTLCEVVRQITSVLILWKKNPKFHLLFLNTMNTTAGNFPSFTVKEFRLMKT